MKIEIDMTQDATPDQVFAMLTDPEFLELRCKTANTTDIGHEVTIDGDATVVTVDRTMPADDLPELLKNFSRGGVRLHEVQKWSPPGADGKRTAEIVLHFVGQPMKMRGELTLTATTSGAAMALRAELTAKVPLIGGKIEKVIAPMVQESLATDEAVGRDWLAGRA